MKKNRHEKQRRDMLKYFPQAMRIICLITFLGANAIFSWIKASDSQSAKVFVKYNNREQHCFGSSAGSTKRN
jgi:hypothetical protein